MIAELSSSPKTISGFQATPAQIGSRTSLAVYSGIMHI